MINPQEDNGDPALWISAALQFLASLNESDNEVDLNSEERHSLTKFESSERASIVTEWTK